MKLIQRLKILIINIAVLIPSVSFAHPLFTYTSDSLRMTEAYVNDNALEISDIEDPYIPGFTISFFGNLDQSKATFSSADFKVSMFLGHEDLFPETPISDGTITLNEYGRVTEWNFELLLKNKKFDPIDGPEDHTWILRSEYGDSTCNCDFLFNEVDRYYPRPNYQWAYYATFSTYYMSDNSKENWSIRSVNVSEPPMGIVMLFGLFCIAMTKFLQKWCRASRAIYPQLIGLT